ncbi:MAG TPA: GFA family protein [Gaiellaceae bacterium]|nr:GFA family protein [Gaiellaceae bacterium]
MTSGRCLCGAVVFEVTEPFVTSSICHCTTCKKISGGAGTVNARARTAAVRVVEGAENVRTYQPAEGSAKSFCAVCGSNLFGAGWPDSEWTSVRVSALDEPVDVRPEKHTYVRSVAVWETLPDDGLPRYETTAQD